MLALLIIMIILTKRGEKIVLKTFHHYILEKKVMVCLDTVKSSFNEIFLQNHTCGSCKQYTGPTQKRKRI